MVMLLVCLNPKCGWRWDYKGQKKVGEYTSCPGCHSSVKVTDRWEKSISQIVSKGGTNMPKPRYTQIPDNKVVGDKTVIDDIADILNEHGRFSVVRDSLVITIIENPAWENKSIKKEFRAPSMKEVTKLETNDRGQIKVPKS